MKVVRVAGDQLESSVTALLDSADFLSSTGFSNLWITAKGTPVWWIAREADEVVAIMPGVEFGLKPVRRFQAMPDGCYSRLLVPGNMAVTDTVRNATYKAISQHGYTRCIVYDFHHEFDKISSSQRINCSTLVAEIDRDWEPPDAKIRSEIRKAEREGVVLAKFHAPTHMEKFIALADLTSQGHGVKRKYSDEFYANLAMLAENDNRVFWYWAEKDGAGVASHINFIDSEMLLNWQVVWDRARSGLKANQYLLQHAAREAVLFGATRLNFGATPVDAESLFSYKKKWGGVEYRYDCLVNNSGMGKLLA